ncbi:MAG: hydrolase [Pirellulales bacterium]
MPRILANRARLHQGRSPRRCHRGGLGTVRKRCFRYAWAMDEQPPLPRSPELMSAGDTGLLVVDVQGKLVGLIPSHHWIIWNIRRLIDGAAVLGVAVAGTEQYPKGLGPTAPELAERLGSISAKLSFSCGACPEIFSAWESRGIHRVLVAGIETHVCVQQTVMDLLAAGRRVYLAVDATGSRHEIDHTTALRRMESAGATLTTTEAALFEWCQAAGTPQFKEISRLVQEQPPSVST